MRTRNRRKRPLLTSGTAGLRPPNEQRIALKACNNFIVSHKFAAMFTRSVFLRLVVSGAILFAGGVALHAAEVQVNVKGMDNKSVNGAEVRIEGGGSGAKQSGKTDQKGRCVFKDLAQGTYRVTVLVNKAPSSLDNVQVRPTVPMRVEFNLKAIAAGKKPRLWAYGKEQGGSYGGRWFELDASGRLPVGFEPAATDTGKSQESQE
jgi:hypothetical protein